MRQKWEDKSMHGQYPKIVNEKDVDHQMANTWLKSGGLESETGCFIIAAKDRAIKTNYYRSTILNDGTDPMCRIYGQLQETTAYSLICPSPLKTKSPKGLEKYIKQIPANIKINELQKITLLGTAHILRKTLSIK